MTGSPGVRIGLFAALATVAVAAAAQAASPQPASAGALPAAGMAPLVPAIAATSAEPPATTSDKRDGAPFIQAGANVGGLRSTGFGQRLGARSGTRLVTRLHARTDDTTAPETGVIDPRDRVDARLTGYNQGQ